jgi:hypothetical protein
MEFFIFILSFFRLKNYFLFERNKLWKYVLIFVRLNYILNRIFKTCSSIKIFIKAKSKAKLYFSKFRRGNWNWRKILIIEFPKLLLLLLPFALFAACLEIITVRVLVCFLSCTHLHLSFIDSKLLISLNLVIKYLYLNMKVIYFLFLSLLCNSTVAFLSLFRSENSELGKKVYTPFFLENEVLNTRGVPQSMVETFELSIFQCDEGMKTLSNDAINDGYCDCLDGTDEPGTSACSGLSMQPTSFYCLNKGFRMIKIPSSRVDDSICDCCDGSDENRLVECPNVCDEAAAQEKEAIKKITSSYNIGSVIREGGIQKIKSEKELQANTLNQLIDDIDRQKVFTDALGIDRDKEHELNERSKIDINNKYFENIKEILGLNLIKSEKDLALILSAMFDVIDISDNEIKNLVNSAISNTDVSLVREDDDLFPEDEDSLHSDDMDMHGDDMHGDDYYGNIEKEYDEEDQVHDDDDIVHEEEIISLDDDVDASSDDNYATTCSLQNYSDDVRLIHICAKFSSSNSKIDDIILFIVKMIQSKRAYIDTQIVFGHFANKASFLTPNENLIQRKQNLVRINMENSDNSDSTCEADYKTSCNIESDLNSLFNSFELELQALTTQLKPASTKHIDALNLLSNLENTKKEVLEAKNDLELFKNKLEYLALKNQCFSVVDGKFTYDMCVLKDISQNDNENSRVTLGNYFLFYFFINFLNRNILFLFLYF